MHLLATESRRLLDRINRIQQDFNNRISILLILLILSKKVGCRASQSLDHDLQIGSLRVSSPQHVTRWSAPRDLAGFHAVDRVGLFRKVHVVGHYDHGLAFGGEVAHHA